MKNIFLSLLLLTVESAAADCIKFPATRILFDVSIESVGGVGLLCESDTLRVAAYSFKNKNSTNVVIDENLHTLYEISKSKQDGQPFTGQGKWCVVFDKNSKDYFVVFLEESKLSARLSKATKLASGLVVQNNFLLTISDAKSLAIFVKLFQK
jgi:hypothetical protein